MTSHLRDALAQCSFYGKNIYLDKTWRHERQYFRFIKRGERYGALNLDIWALTHLIKPKDTVLDAGANVGLTAVICDSSGAGEIYCVEPDLRVLPRLQLNCPDNKYKIYPIALGRSCKEATITLSTQHNQGSTMCSAMIQKFPDIFEKSTNQPVQVDSIDKIFSKIHFDFYKIDVEGSELDLIIGSKEHFKSEFRPRTVYIELYDEFFEDARGELEKYYHHVYRVVCNTQGDGRLIDLKEKSQNFSDIAAAPPSFIFTNEDLSQLTKKWIPPKTP